MIKGAPIADMKRLYICGADEIDDYGTHGITHIIRIVNPGVQSVQPTWFDGEYLQLSFGDVVSEADAIACRTKAPDLNDIRQAIVFCRLAYLRQDSRILISCDYGASRSPALAYVILADQMGSGREFEAFEMILQTRPDSVPNSRVVMIGDKLLGRNGTLMNALRAFYGEIESSLQLFQSEVNVHHDK